MDGGKTGYFTACPPGGAPGPVTEEAGPGKEISCHRQTPPTWSCIGALWCSILTVPRCFRGSRYTVGNMAGMSASGSGPAAAAGPVQQGLKEALIETLTAILSPVQEVRAAAEEQVKVLEVTEGKQARSRMLAGL